MKKILIVDDTPSNIDILVGFLSDDYELLISLDGYQALNILETEIPELILLDIRMPGIDGFETCKRIKQIPLVSKIPIIFLTAETDEESIKNAFISGGVDYIKKPIILQELKARIQTHINLFSYTNNLEILVEEKTNQIKEYLYLDKITLLKNHSSLKEEIEIFKNGSLFILDINNFNIYNKLNGFSYGNKVLKAVAIELQKIMDNDFILYKLSVDRFAIVCKEYNKYLIDSFCKKIFTYFDNLSLQIDTIDNFVNFCIGITKITNYEKSIIEAEYALDYAKTLSNGSYIIYEKNSNFVQEEYESISSLKQVRAYILEKKIVPFFQPIVDVQTQKIIKYEALARIKDVDKIITPDKFLKSAERLGMICDITKDMIIKSFEVFKNTDIKFSINLTQKDILDKNLLDFIKNNAVFYNINLSNVTFEILENLTLAEDDTKIKNMISSLKENGCKIAIDDFGSENSNFSRLLSLHADYIKIDGIFIKNCDKEIEKQKIIKAIVELSKTLEIKCVAEFVSSKEIFDTIKSLGVDYAQGYYFGKPDVFIENMM
jgi:EAL domain-containing protein (putative c-di-GMP-specific phosphodiesterase class I)/CheY-like chemotaxis protein